MTYDNNNIFAKILREEIPCKKVYENDYALAFHDINPQAKIHILIIPKGKYISFADFSKNASKDEIDGFFKALGKVAEDQNLVGEGYRILANHGAHAGQEVPHFHFHIFGKQPLGPMISPSPGPTFEIEVAAPEIADKKSKPVIDKRIANNKNRKR